MAAQNNGSGTHVDHAATYRIRVQGYIGPNRTDWFEGMTITSTPPTQHPAITTLSGILVDQAALLGVLNSLHDLRLTVLSVECLDENYDHDIAT